MDLDNALLSSISRRPVPECYRPDSSISFAGPPVLLLQSSVPHYPIAARVHMQVPAIACPIGMNATSRLMPTGQETAMLLRRVSSDNYPLGKERGVANLRLHTQGGLQLNSNMCIEPI